VDVPGRGEQGGGAGAPAGGSGGDVADGQVDRGGRGHGVLLHQGAGSCAGAVDHRPVRGPLSARWMDSSWRYRRAGRWRPPVRNSSVATSRPELSIRSEEHTSELQSRFDLVCRLLLEKKISVDRL